MRTLRLLPPVLLVLVLLLSPAATSAQIAELISAGMTVSDADRSVAFYEEVLDFEKVSDIEVDSAGHSRLVGVFGARMRVVRMRLGMETIELTEYVAPAGGRPVPADSRSHDRWFQHVAIVVSDMDAAYARLRAHGVGQVSTAPQRLPDWNPNAGGIEAFYFQDPDGHVLEAIRFPEGKGDVRWHGPTDRLFLGIDHTAIVVGDTDASRQFYRDRLGLTVAGESENWGPEQERLNQVFGARLRITTLRAPVGPAVELLEYLAPSDGRAMPSDSRSNDLWHWRIHMRVADSERIEDLARGAPWVSPGLVEVGDGMLGYDRGLLLRDTDGHAVLLTPTERSRP